MVPKAPSDRLAAFTSIVDAMMKTLLALPAAQGLTEAHQKVIRVFLEETAQESAQRAYTSCQVIAVEAQRAAAIDRDQVDPSSRQYAALDAAVGAFGGMAATYQRLKDSVCYGVEYDEPVPTYMDAQFGVTSPPERLPLRDPRVRQTQQSAPIPSEGAKKFLQEG